MKELNKLVGDLMRYALFLDHNKTPLRREDISKTILKEHKRASKQVKSLSSILIFKGNCRCSTKIQRPFWNGLD